MHCSSTVQSPDTGTQISNPPASRQVQHPGALCKHQFSATAVHNAAQVGAAPPHTALIQRNKPQTPSLSAKPHTLTRPCPELAVAIGWRLALWLKVMCFLLSKTRRLASPATASTVALCVVAGGLDRESPGILGIWSSEAAPSSLHRAVLWVGQNAFVLEEIRGLVLAQGPCPIKETLATTKPGTTRKSTQLTSTTSSQLVQTFETGNTH